MAGKRVIQEVEDLGELDNTLIIYIGGDNGASAEGGSKEHAGPHHSGHVPGGRNLRHWPGHAYRRALLEYRYDVPFKFTGKIDKLTFKLAGAAHGTNRERCATATGCQRKD